MVAVPRIDQALLESLKAPAHSGSLPLAGVRVVDFGWVWAVPLVGHILADFGAQVIKVESPLHLDYTRATPPLGGRKDDPDWALGFHPLHRNKMSITVNLRTPEGKALIRQLVAISDVVLENFAPGTLDRLGLGYQDLRRVRPDLVMLSISSAGQTGPLNDIVSYCPTAGALAGVETLVGYEGQETLGSQTAFLDPVTALYGIFALLVALHYRSQTGIGQHLDLSLLETGVSLLAEPLVDYQWNGRVWDPRGNAEYGFAPHNVYPCRAPDTWVAIAVQNEAQWRALLSVMGNPPWAQEPRFSDPLSRYHNRAELDDLIRRWTVTQERDALVQRLQEAGVPASASYTLPELPFQEHYRHRRLYIAIDHPTLPNEIIPGVFWKMSATPGSVRRHAPLLGEHTAYVHRELLGLSAGTMAQERDVRC